MPLVYAFAFGALISPTDPVAVERLVSEAGLRESLQTVIGGEFLFNDGVGTVFWFKVSASNALRVEFFDPQNT